MRIACLLPCGAALLLCAVAPAIADPPSLVHSVPSAAAPGRAVDVTLFGGNLAGATGMWTSFSSVVAMTPDVADNGTQAGSVTYRVTLPADAQVGIGGMRVATGGGISNLRLLMIDDLASVAENGQNGSREQAQRLELPIAVDGKIDAEQSDYFQFHAEAGQHFTFEVVARRLGFALDPVMRLLDAAGRELLYADDDPSIEPDCRCAFTAPATGDYTIELRDVRYQGGDAHRYRLRIGNFPLVSTTFPLAARIGRQSELQAAGTAIAGVTPMSVALPEDCLLSVLPMGMRLADGAGSAVVNVAASDLDELCDAEPNDDAETATPIALPCAVNGRLERPRDRDWYTFTAPAGSRFLVRLQTRSLGSPTDLSLRVVNAAGERLAEFDNAGGGDREFDFSVPGEGAYHLAIEDLYRRGGPELTYRVELRPYEPGFTLIAESEKFDVPRGGVFVTKIVAQRRDYNGPITLAVEGLGDQVRLSGETIAEGQSETTLQTTVAESMETGRFAPVRIVGRARIGERDYTSSAKTSDVLSKAFAGLTYPPSALDGAVGVGVGPVFPEFFKLALDRETVPFPRLVGSSTFAVKAERLNGFEEGVAISVEGLPSGITAEAPSIDKGQSEAMVKLTGPALLTDAPYSMRIVGSGTFQNQPQRVVLADVPLRVVDPLVLQSSLAEALTPGATKPLKVVVTRYGEPSPVQLSLMELPAGVTAPADVSVAADQQEVDVPLTVAADAAPGAYDNVAVVAVREVGGQRVIVRSSVSLQIASAVQ